MPGTMTVNENRLSLLSVEVLISHVQIDLNVECHLPCMVFRLLDYPAVSIPYFDSWQIDEFHQLKRNHPKLAWSQLLSDQFYELRSANGKFKFNRGKSCLFKTYFKTLYTHLLNVPLFILLIDQINDQGANNHTTHFIGSGNVKLNELIEKLYQSIVHNGDDIPLVEQETFHCTLFNLMGTRIGVCDLAVRFCHYGSTILTHLPMLDKETAIKKESAPDHVDRDTVPIIDREQVGEPVLPVSHLQHPPTTTKADTVIKHIHFVNEKRDVGLQLSRSDLPTVSKNEKSAQTRWTSTKSHTVDDHHSKSRYLRAIEDPLLDDSSFHSYQPPPLYFNAHSDFLHMMTPESPKFIDEAKENRLAYLASIPIASFTDENNIDRLSEDDDTIKQQRKFRSTHNVRFNLPASSIGVSKPKAGLKPQVLPVDFLQQFPLLRSLVAEALALQQTPNDPSMPLAQFIFDQRPNSAIQGGSSKSKPSPSRAQSAGYIRSTSVKSVIHPRKVNNTGRRLYPPPPEARQMVVTKAEVRHLVDRLSKPKFNKYKEQQIAAARQIIEVPPETIVTPRLPPKPVSVQTKNSNKTATAHKPPPSYRTTHAHRLYTAFSRARREANDAKSTKSPRSQGSPRRESPANDRLPPSPPQLLNTGTLSHFSLLNKVDIDSATIDRNSIPQGSTELLQENLTSNLKSSSTTSEDVTLELNRAPSSSSSSSTTPEPTISPRRESNNERDYVNHSITDSTDFFTDGSVTRPSTQQSP